MGFLDKIKSAGHRLKEKVADFFLPDDRDPPPPAPDTSRYIHVSAPLVPIEDPLLRKLLGQDYFLGPERSSRNVGNNAMKRFADLASTNNKSSRRLRSRLKRRAEELRLQNMEAM